MRHQGIIVARLIPACAAKTRTGCAPARASRAHPRACGENSSSCSCHGRRPGSSPRVRGKPGRAGDRVCDLGLIPARAGKTGARGLIPRPGPAHPRACGENRIAVTTPYSPEGSSPRVRGKREGACSNLSRAGLIPACAGKTGASSTRGRLCPAHPRVCGENCVGVHFCSFVAGSSPRVRGKRGHPPGHRVGAGLIPARAGKTGRPRCCADRRRAHPRVCGENLVRVCKKQLAAGSSPRVRGKPRSRHHVVEARGLIPACAGKTSVFGLAASSLRAHPRVCGENAQVGHRDLVGDGSSPRVRGKHSRRGGVCRRSRLIPACAGKTANPRCPRAVTRAHPRVCGEN